MVLRLALRELQCVMVSVVLVLELAFERKTWHDNNAQIKLMSKCIFDTLWTDLHPGCNVTGSGGP